MPTRRVLAPLALLAGLVVLYAQVEQATILGTIVDNAGALVPGASVTVRNSGTDERRTAKSDGRGYYEVPALNIGTYEVSVEHAGFRKETVSGITLVVNQRARIDVKLEIGAVTQELTVQSQAPLVQTDDATVSQLINQRQITELPIPANRNMFRLALMGAGMSPGPPSSVTTSGLGRASASQPWARRCTTTGSCSTARPCAQRFTEPCACVRRWRPLKSFA